MAGGIKTGDAGFEIDGKVYDFDVGDPNAPGLDPKSPPDKGDIKIDGSVKDISKKTKSTLGKYLSDLTKGSGVPGGVPNRFSIDAPSVPGSVNETKTTDENGVPSPLVDTGNTQRFIDKASADGAIDLPAGDPMASVGGGFSKGKTYPQGLDGHDLLPSVTKNNLPAPLQRYTSAVLQNNRFVTAEGRIGAEDYDGSVQSGDKFFPIRAGSNNKPPADYNATLKHPRYGDIDQLKLAQIGNSLSLRSSGEFPSFESGFNPTGAGAAGGAIAPSPAQLGILKINNVLFEAQDAFENLSNTEVSPNALGETLAFGDQSWGNLNNIEEPWNGTLNLGMIALALAFQVALLLVFEGIGTIVSLVGGGLPPTSTSARKASGAYIKGGRYATNKINTDNSSFPPPIMTLLGLNGTLFPFGDALKVGATAFFLGADVAKEDLGSQVAAGVTQLADSLFDNASSGYLIIVSRLITRSGQAVAQGVTDIGKAFANNPVAGAKSVVGLLNVIKQSKLISAINIFTTIGDAILSEDNFNKSMDDSSGVEKGISKFDAYNDDVPGASVKKGRLRGDGSSPTMKLAWASNRVPTSYLIPDSVMTMQLLDNKLGGFKGVLGLADRYNKNFLYVQKASEAQSLGARIPTGNGIGDEVTVRNIEAALESEYMPFYFHDLRTNEIIGFHAFLAGLTDGYQVGWESTDAYGRVDPVKTYKNTTRKITMNFYVAATSEEDFDDMWVKLNKLVTLVYPQYTAGRTLKDDVTSFTQPFSQLIGASPLIRIRLGDLIKSNYSRFALARLFGAANTGTDSAMILKGTPVKFENALDIIEKVKKPINDAYQSPDNKFTLNVVGWNAATSTDSPSTSVGSGPSKPDQSATLDIDGTDLSYFYFKVTSYDTKTQWSVVEVVQYEPAELEEQFGMSTASAKSIFDFIKAKYSSDDNVRQKVLSNGAGLGYAVPIDQLRLTKESFNRIVKDASADAAAAVDGIEALHQFLDIEKNALVKSFRSVQGKGLAGTIDALDFDWYDKVTWDVRPEHRAPKMCRVTISFSPIHDISPGLDSLGFNRAPVYAVGGAMGNGFDPDKSG